MGGEGSSHEQSGKVAQAVTIDQLMAYRLAACPLTLLVDY